MSKCNTYFFSITCILLGLSGCLVDEDSIPPTYIRTTDTLHIYKSGDFLSYTVSGTNLSNSSPISGELVVRWSAHNDLVKPLNSGGSIPVLQETTTLTITGYNDTIVRYISQEEDLASTRGTLRVHAFDNAGVDEYLWLNSDGDLSTYEAIDVFLSPVAIGQAPTYTFYTLPGCDGQASCDPSTASMSESYEVTESETITTELGQFEAYKIKLSNLTVIYHNGSYLYDIRHFCANVDTTSSGTIWVFPEVGIVKYEIVCTNPMSGFTLFNASLNSTNIDLPPSL